MNNEFTDLLKNIPVLKCKAIADILNGVEVIEEQVWFRNTTSTFPKRVFHCITGEDLKRQNIIDQTLNCSIKGLTTFMQELNENQLYTYQTMSIVQEKLMETRNGLARLIDNHLTLKDEVAKLKTKIATMYDLLDAKINMLSQDVALQTLRQDTHTQIDSIFAKWEAGYLDKLHPFFQLTFVLQELFWGAFGKYSRIHHEFNDIVYNKCKIQMKRIYSIPSTEKYVSLNAELIKFPQQIPIYKEAFVYLLEQKNLQPNRLPILYTFSQLAILSDENDAQNWLENNRLMELPFLTTYERLLEKIMEETMAHTYIMLEDFSYDNT